MNHKFSCVNYFLVSNTKTKTQAITKIISVIRAVNYNNHGGHTDEVGSFGNE